MSAHLVVLHVAFAGLWLGCVLTETLFERALLGKGREAELMLARLHVRVDVLIEVPAMAGVLASGLALSSAAEWTALRMAMAGLGLLAIAVNGVCVVIVSKRAGAAQANAWERFARLDEAQHKLGAVVLAALLAAFGTGLLASG